jgi:hypothetical protein
MVGGRHIVQKANRHVMIGSIAPTLITTQYTPGDKIVDGKTKQRQIQLITSI